MPQAFDTIAQQYDVSFTNSLIGTAQRNIVWNHLERSLPQNKKLKVLELNCGTGEDALWFAKHGHTVLATDVSEKMLAITQRKIEDASMEFQVQTHKLDITQIENFDYKMKFDLIFSNFGGINCVSEKILIKVPVHLKNFLNRDGRLIMVVMPSFCFWETVYFLTRLKFGYAFRRLSKSGTIANLNGAELKTYYYSPKKLQRVFDNFFTAVAMQPVGFFIPPSYLEKYFDKNYKLFNWLIKMENLIHNRKLLSGYSDHYLIDFTLKQK
jgi:ubiquinone/menaquinone biosynthesis C-methylase UbiE